MLRRGFSLSLAAALSAAALACTPDDARLVEPDETPELLDAEVRTYTGVDATKRMLEIVRTELSDPVALERNAPLNGQTPEERRVALQAVVEFLEARLDATVMPEAVTAASGGCHTPTRYWLETDVRYVPPLFEGSTVGEWYDVSGYTWFNKAAILKTTVSAYHGHRRDWHGPPAVGAPWEYHGEEESSTCINEQLVELRFKPIERPGYAWAITAHRYKRQNGSWNTHSTEDFDFNPGSGGPVW